MLAQAQTQQNSLATPIKQPEVGGSMSSGDSNL